MPRFAILDHDHPFQHWDFLLETGGILRAWRLLEEPGRGREILAEALPDHRRLYLEYEGPVTGGRGRLCRWDSGEYSGDANHDKEIRVQLLGERLRGSVVVSRAPDGRWTWTWH